MMRSIFKLAAAGGLLTCLAALPAAGQETHEARENSTAYTALRLVGKTLGADAINRVVEVSGRDGKPQPTSWRITLKEGEGTREVEVVNGKIEAQRPLSKPASTAPVKLQDLNLDSSGAFEATDMQARKVHVRFDAINYALRTNEKTGKPLWTLELVTQDGGSAGAMQIAANNGTVASMEGRIASEEAAPPKKSVAVADKPPVKLASATPRSAAATPKPSPALAVAERPATRRETVRNTTVTTTATTTTVGSATPVPVAVVDVPDADASGPAATLPTQESGGFFTRAGRTLDHTSHTVANSVDQAGHTVDHHVRRAGATVQRFFTGHSDLDADGRPAPVADTQPD